MINITIQLDRFFVQLFMATTKIIKSDMTILPPTCDFLIRPEIDGFMFWP